MHIENRRSYSIVFISVEWAWKEKVYSEEHLYYAHSEGNYARRRGRQAVYKRQQVLL